MRWRKVMVRTAFASAAGAGILSLAGAAGGPSVEAQVGPAYRVFAIQSVRSITPTGARCNDQVHRAYTGPDTCAGHGGIHYWIYA